MLNVTKKYPFFLIPLIFAIFYLLSCAPFNDNYHFIQNKVEKDTLRYIKGSEKSVEVWRLDHYEPMPGKTIGVWLSNYSQEHMTECRTHWGYKSIFIVNINNYKKAVAAGYNSDDIMMSVAYNPGTMDYQNIISSCNARCYYIDEAVNHSCFIHSSRRLYTPVELRNVRNYIHTARKGSFFVSSGYKRCTHFDTLAAITDKIMYSAYSDWYVSFFPCFNTNMSWGPAIEFAWLNGSYDQRSSWEDMKNRYGDKFSMTWINSYEISEFDDLFNEAEKLDLKEIWIYTRDEHHYDQFASISRAAYRHGFLRRFMRKYIDVYICTGKDGCTGFNPGDSECWHLQKEESTDTVMED
jgi:hypothetical protein